MKKGTPLGLKAGIYVERATCPDDIMIGIIREKLAEPQLKNGFILDGFPRTVSQAEALEKVLADLHYDNGVIIVIQVDEEELVKRLTNRRACKVCNSIFNNNEIAELTECPNCGAKYSFFQRPDDEEKVIRKRLKIFRETTLPVVDYYNNSTKIYGIDGLHPINEVSEQITKIINKTKENKKTVDA